LRRDPWQEVGQPLPLFGGKPQEKGDVLVVDGCEQVLAMDVDLAERATFLGALADMAGPGA
jgi:hypothetical protein